MIDNLSGCMFSHIIVRRIFGAIAASSGAAIALWIDIPLPWLLGPLFVTAALRLASMPVAAYKPLRSVGQWVIGVSLGLYFSPEITDLVLTHWLVIVIGMLIPLLLAAFGTWVLRTIGKADLKTAWFSSAIGGASEMSILAERYGGRVDLVASAHSLRILAVVVFVPFGFEAWGIVGSDISLLSGRAIVIEQLVMVAPLALVCGLLFVRLGISNPWVLGPLLGTALLTVTGVVSTSLPSWMSSVGQLLIGWSLGDRYRPAFFKAAPRFLTGVAIFTAGSLAMVAFIGWCISLVSELPLATIWLGMSPGGLAEMAITAKVLQLGVPLVTAMQVSRMAFVVMVTGWIYQKWILPKIEKDGPTL